VIAEGVSNLRQQLVKQYPSVVMGPAFAGTALLFLLCPAYRAAMVYANRREEIPE
jgi:hypothetical protein